MRTLGLAACVAACSALPLAAAVDPLLLGLLPPATKVVVGLNVQNTADSDLAQVFITRPKVDEKLERFMQKTGFDPRRDLQYVLVASAGAGRGNPDVVVARGSFDVSRLLVAAQSKGAKVEEVSGVNVVEMLDGKEMSAVAFPVAGVAVVGPPSLVKAIVRARGTPSTLEPGLSRRIDEVSGNDVWFASLSPLSSFPSSIFQGQASAVGQGQIAQSILEESGGVQFGSNISFSFHAVTRSPQDAKAFEDVIRFATSMLEAKTENDPQAALLDSAVVQNLQTAVTGSDVQVGASVPEKVLEDYLTSLGNKH